MDDQHFLRTIQNKEDFSANLIDSSITVPKGMPGKISVMTGRSNFWPTWDRRWMTFVESHTAKVNHACCENSHR